MSPSPGATPETHPRFPRVSGDEPFWPPPIHMAHEFSPRERG